MPKRKNTTPEGFFDVDKEMAFYSSYYNGVPNSVKEINRLPRNRPNIHKVGEHRKREVQKLDMVGNVLNTYASLKEAADNSEISPSSVSQCVRGLIPTAGGFKWRYKHV